ncbi:MAG: type 4a pilus biogenesis protein PilO [Desulfobacteraceae bacterium]|nr:type 4a pilus biogenesis protein PilO [Desulfobacteraceae bacterium]
MIAGTKNNREKLLATIAATVILGAVTFIAIIEPQLKERKLRLERMHQLQLNLTKMKGDLLIKDRIDNIYSQIKPLIASNGTDQQEISLFTRELSDLYSKLNVRIRLVKILPIVNEEFYKRLSVKIEMSGHVKNILNFIRSVEAYPNLIRIEQFDLKAREIIDNVQASFLITKVVAEPET